MSKVRASLLLHKRDASPPSCAVMMLGHILGIQFQYREPNLLALEHKGPEYKKLNPMGTIPILEDGDFVISESHAIMKYLLFTYGAAQRERLYPAAAQAQARVDQAMYFDAGVMFNALKSVALPTLLHGLQGPTATHLATINESYEALEAYLTRSEYVAADHLTLADLSLVSTVAAMQVIHKLESDRFPRSTDWVSRLEAESFFKEVNAPGAAAFAKLMKVFWVKNRSKK